MLSLLLLYFYLLSLHKSLHRGLGVNIIMLDNMSPGDIAKVYEELVRKGLMGRVVLGASGRINEDSVMEYARYVDVVSIGALTHSYKSINMSMDLIRRISNTILLFCYHAFQRLFSKNTYSNPEKARRQNFTVPKYVIL
ncbi:MAG: hypothetical protein RXO25_02135 [Caldivirga sp.]